MLLEEIYKTLVQRLERSNRLQNAGNNLRQALVDLRVKAYRESQQQPLLQSIRARWPLLPLRQACDLLGLDRPPVEATDGEGLNNARETARAAFTDQKNTEDAEDEECCDVKVQGLEPDEVFQFDCNASVSCLNVCCRNLRLQLTPYDIIRLGRHLELDSDTFLQQYTETVETAETGFPIIELKMSDNEHKSCPFALTGGCSVYPDRPSRCRSFPVGKVDFIDNDGDPVHISCLLKEPYCEGFGLKRNWTVDQWYSNQGLDEAEQYNRRYIELVTRYKSVGRHLSDKQREAVDTALYHVDRFDQMIKDRGLFFFMGAKMAKRREVQKTLESRLNFALDWLEYVLFL